MKRTVNMFNVAVEYVSAPAVLSFAVYFAQCCKRVPWVGSIFPDACPPPESLLVQQNVASSSLAGDTLPAGCILQTGLVR